jgi:flagellar motor protein MotB
MPNAKLTVAGMADHRGARTYNWRLSERRVAIVKDFLVAQGIAPELITGDPRGEEAALDQAAVEQLEAKNPQQPAAGRASAPRPSWLAYNRRVDVAIEPAAMESARFYPHQANDSQLLYEPNRVTDSKIYEASQSGTVVAAGN